jgi:hypothetical protein
LQGLKSVKNPKIAFTTKYDNKVRVLKTKIGISPYKKDQPIIPKPDAEGLAIWDTGATGTVINPKVATSLKMKPIGKKQIAGVTGKSNADMYLVNLFLPNRVQIVGIPVVEADVLGADVLIGMDVITMGDFAVTNSYEKTKLTYQMPSTHDIDFVGEINREVTDRKSKEIAKGRRKSWERSRRKKKK